MKLIFFLSLTFAFFFQLQSGHAQCNDQLTVDCKQRIAAKATPQTDFLVKLSRGSRGQEPPSETIDIELKQNTMYRIAVCRACDYDGMPIIELYGNGQMISSSNNEDRIDFLAPDDATYQLKLFFQDGKEGCAVIVVAIVE